MRAVGIESVRPEPTVFGAVRRYWVMVLAVALAGLVAAAAYSLTQTKIYRAYASVTVPVPVLLQGQQADPAQYLDSQVLLLQSQGVAQRAAVIADGELGGHVLTAGDFVGVGSKLVITPPVTATPGGYGASVIALWFGWPDARVAQLGADAVLQAFDHARSAAIAAQADATVAGINQTLAQTSDKRQQQALLGERAQVVTNEQVNLASHAALGWAVQPTAPLNGGLKRTAAIGLVIGLMLGAALAYGRASRRPGFANRKDPAALNRSRTAVLGRRLHGAGRRLGWGVADQAVSSLTNFAVGIFVARSLGAVQFGAFSLAYVTYTFVLNASRGLASDPLVVRFSGVDPPIWRRAVASCTGTATLAGCAAGICVLAAAMLLSGTTKVAFLALGLTLPGLMLQDSWRFAFFAAGRGNQAFLNDLTWAVVQIPAMALLLVTHHASVFWVVLAWGAAATVAAGVGPLQAHVVPKLSEAPAWVSRHRDLGPRYLAENTASGGAVQLRTYAIGVILGLAAVGYVRAAEMLMGPFLILSMGISWAAVPEAVRVLRRSSRHLRLFCLSLGAGLAVTALGWGVVLLLLLPRGLGSWLLGSIWRPTYPLLLPATVTVIAGCFSVGASAGMRALGAARQSLRVQVLASAAYLIGGIGGALTEGPIGTMRGTALATMFAASLWWWQLRAALADFEKGFVPRDDLGADLSAGAHVSPQASASGRPAPSGR
jgi:O-antigen/teichoic acid export membrane protein